MNPVQPKKLLLSKWTAVTPRRKEKHFLVIQVVAAEPPGESIEWVDIEAVFSGSVQRIAWRDLQNSERWRQGWT